jgi:hypothetical protein
MNKNKTGGIWVGKLKHSKDKIDGIKREYIWDFLKFNIVNWYRTVRKVQNLISTFFFNIISVGGLLEIK